VAVIERTHLKRIGGSYLAHQVDRVAILLVAEDEGMHRHLRARARALSRL